MSRSTEELKLQSPKGWKEREQELTSRFTNIINVLQAEILKLKSTTDQKLSLSNSYPGLTVGPNSGTLDQLVKGLLSIPDIKEKLWQRLEQELLDVTPAYRSNQ